MVQDDEFRRTIGYGEAAIAHLRRNRLPAYPRHYELWYSYASGFNARLNKAINDSLREHGSVSLEEIEMIYNIFLSPSRLSDRIDEVSAGISEEISEIVKVLEESFAAGSDYAGNIEKAVGELEGARTDEIREIAQRLAAASGHALAQNRRLQQKLDDSQQQIAGLQRSLDVIRFESLTDELTTLANRKHFDQSIERLVADARSEGVTFSLLLTDIDHFKLFNDQHGHQTGDQVLRLVGLAVKQNIKGHDIACRYGGEEFAILLPGTSLPNAVIVAEYIRAAVMSKELVKRSTGENLGNITMSIGVAVFRPHDTPQSMLERADTALYAAKRSGRNRVCSEPEPRVPDADDLPQHA